MDFQIFRSRFEILWPVTFLYREKFVIVASSRSPIILFVSARFLSTARNWILRSLHIYIYVYYRQRNIYIKMQWKFVFVVCLIAEFSSFFASCNMPFRITEILFSLPYIISSISSLCFFIPPLFPIFFSILFVAEISSFLQFYPFFAW